MRYRMKHLLVLALLGVPGWAHAGWFGPSDRDECLADAAKNAKTDSGVKIAAGLCYKQFPPMKRDCEADSRRWKAANGFPWNVGDYTSKDCERLYPALFERQPNYFDKYDEIPKSK